MVCYGTSPKRLNGQYFTEGNPFRHRAFQAWASRAGLPGQRVLEPFAGANSLIEHLRQMGLCRTSASFDIEPATPSVQTRDTIADFPTGFEVCVTNPPWLARNSATIRGLPFPDTPYDDLYKTALEQCLRNCRFVAALVPESYIRSGVFTERLSGFVSLTSSLFSDTGHPVGLALWDGDNSETVEVWSGDHYVGRLDHLERMRPKPKRAGMPVTFNAPEGNVGLIALDNTLRPSIRFCEASELDHYQVKRTGRHITKLAVEGRIAIPDWNEYINEFRFRTQDVLMTSYKGIRKDGKYRRRLDWQLARGIIHNVA